MRHRKRGELRTNLGSVLFWTILVACLLSHHTASSKRQQVFQPDHTIHVFQFAHPVYNVTIPENSVGKTYAQQPPNEDRLGIRAIPNVSVKFRIVNGDRDKLFKAEERIVGDFVFLAIRTRTGHVILNREKTEEYKLTVNATAQQQERNGRHLYECQTVVNLRVLDRNDLSPLFYPNTYTKTIPEDMPLHKSILKVIAEDADLGSNGEIYYSFLDMENEQFGIHPTSGVLTLTRPLKYQYKSIHELTVLATDRGIGSNHRLNQASKAKVTIKVEPVSFFLCFFFSLNVFNIIGSNCGRPFQRRLFPGGIAFTDDFSRIDGCCCRWS